MKPSTQISENKKSASDDTTVEIRLFTWMTLFMALFTGVLALIFMYQAFSHFVDEQVNWQIMLLGGVLVISSAISAIASKLQRPVLERIMLLSVNLQIAMIVLSALLMSAGVPAALIALLSALLLSFLSANIKRQDYALVFGLAGAIITALIGIFSPFDRVILPAAVTLLLAMLGLQIILYIVLLAGGFVHANLRTKLITAALAIAIIPLVTFSLVLSRYTSDALRTQNHESIRLAAYQTGEKLDEYLIQSISKTIVDAKSVQFVNYLQLSEEQRFEPGILSELQLTAGSIRDLDRYGSVESIALIDINGINVFDTNPIAIGRWEGNRDYVSQPLKTGRSYSSPVLFDPTGFAYITFSSPVRDQDLKMLGILRVRHRAEVLQNIISVNRGLLGQHSYPILIDESFLRLADVVDSDFRYHPIIHLTEARISDMLISNRLPNLKVALEEAYLPEAAQAINNLPDNPYFTLETAFTNEIPYAGAVVKLRTAPWYVVYQQRQDSLYFLLKETSDLTILVATILVAAVSLVTLLLTRLFSRPILKLTAAAESIAAGDFTSHVDINSKDEFGVLSTAFNTMARQIYTLIHQLEARVQERTVELSQQNRYLSLRSQQIQTVSDVARSIASTLDQETLLDQVTNLISERFNFYHVGIFLIDSIGEYAVLRAANSEDGKRMLARGHKLKVGATGIVGYTCGTREARIASDVGKDSVFFNNPDLPLTRSEMALPLKAGGQVIGALDVQSVEANAFTQDDIELFGILADQVAIAIVNNRLYADTNQALAEIQDLHRRYLRMEWKREAAYNTHHSYRYTAQGIVAQEIVVQPELEVVFETGQPLVNSENDNIQLAVPIMLRGEPIGVIQLQELGQKDREWTPDEIETIQTLSNQIALALENARLLEQTTRRAERERKVLDITSKIRSTNDFNSMIQIAVEELQLALGASRAQVIFHSAPEEEIRAENGKERRDSQ